MSSDESDDDVPQLSSETLCVLMEFYLEQDEREEKLRQIEEGNIPDKFDENWNLSQFWYSEDTAKLLAEECLRAAGRDGAIACISSPTLYRALRDTDHNCTLKVLEYDTRFAVYKDDYVFYDFRNPMCVKRELREQFDVIVADPPYLSEDCLTKTAITIKFLMKPDARIVVCSGLVMEELANRLLGLTKCQFEIRHEHNLNCGSDPIPSKTNQLLYSKEEVTESPTINKNTCQRLSVGLAGLHSLGRTSPAPVKQWL